MKKLLQLLGLLVCVPVLAFAQAAAPVISPVAGSYASTQSVTVTSSTSGADIFCTTDGTIPTPESTKYTGPITLTSNTTVKCIAAVAGVRRNNIQNDSPSASGTYWKAADSGDTGGNRAPTSVTHISGVASPSLSGASMKFSFTGSAGGQTNVLWAVGGGFGKCDTCNYRLYDFYLYDDAGTCSAHATTEQDVYKFAPSLGLRYMGGAQWRRGTGGCASGHQCLDIAGNNNTGTGGSTWVNSGVSTTLFTCGAFHHFQRAEHSVPSEVTSKPCVDFHGTHWPYLYEDYWIVDGTRFDNGGAGWKYCANALPGGWGAVDGPQHQGDVGSGGGTWTEYLDNANYVAYFPGSTVTSNAFTITGGTGTPTAATPSISPAGGFYTTTQTVTLADATPAAVIHYTTDGSTPTSASTTYSTALSVTTTTTVKAIAIASGYINSSVASAVYTFTSSAGLTATPTFSPTAGSYTSTQFIILSDTTSGAVIYYTTNGTTPTTSSNVYSVPLSVSATATIKAMAVAPGFTNSSVASATYTITATLTAATPTFSPLAGNYGGTQTVTISDTTPAAVIHYTTSGTAPTCASTTYSTALSVSSTTTLKAIACASGYTDSAIGTALYTIGCGATPLVTGNIDATQLKPGSRQGSGAQIQMAAGGFTTGHAPIYDCNGNLIDSGSAPGTGTVTSVGLSLPAIFSVSGSPVTSSGTLTAALATQTANTFFSGPSSGSAAAPTFRTIAPADLPVSSSSAFGAAKCDGTTITCSGGVYAAVGGGSGTVTSVGLSLPAIFSVSGSPVTGSGTLTGALATETANTFFAGPSSGSAAAPTFRAIAAADLPLGSSSAFGAMKCDNTTVTCPGGVLSSTGGSTVFYGQGDGVASTGNNAVTLGSTPVSGSAVSVWVNGGIIRPSTYSITGAVVTLGSGLTSGDVVVADWVTSNSTPGSISLGTAGVPTLRGTGIAFSTTTGITISLPAGTVAGDLAVIMPSGGFNISTPSGWTANDTTFNSAAWWSGAVFSKVLSSGDITTGSVTVTFSGSFDHAITIATIAGSSFSVLNATSSDNGSPGGTSVSLSSGFSASSSNLLLYMGSNRASSTNTVSSGTLKQQGTNSSNASATLYSESGVSGTFSRTFSYTSGGNGNYQVIIRIG